MVEQDRWSSEEKNERTIRLICKQSGYVGSEAVEACREEKQRRDTFHKRVEKGRGSQETWDTVRRGGRIKGRVHGERNETAHETFHPKLSYRRARG